MITLRRVYDVEKIGEKYKILVDRLWPRGITKEKASCNEWLKEIAPSNELRKWYNHDPAKWDEFKQMYKDELAGRKYLIERLRQLETKYGNLTLLYSSREREFNNAAALKEFLTEKD